MRPAQMPDMSCPIIFLRIGRPRRTQAVVRLKVVAIFRGNWHDSPLALPLIALLACWLRGVSSLLRNGHGESLAPAFSTNAPHPRASLLLFSSTAFPAVLFPKKNYVLSALYLLGDTRTERSRILCGQTRRHKNARRKE